jgi:hypothetical protein
MRYILIVTIMLNGHVQIAAPFVFYEKWACEEMRKMVLIRTMPAVDPRAFCLEAPPR